MSIRSTAKALIINDGKILLNRCADPNNGEYYSLPGGGQREFETLREAVVRECKEETGYAVRPVKFAALCETICLDEVFREKHPGYAHKMYHIFLCGLAGAEREASTETDDMQTGTEWLDINKLNEIRLLPEIIGRRVSEILKGEAPVFLGSEKISYNHG